MGLSVVLETENGEPLESAEDPKNLLHRVLPSHGDISFQLLRFVDWYGDTTFNRHQIETLLVELDRLMRQAQTTEERELLARIIDLARRCQDEPHLYLKFYGD